MSGNLVSRKHVRDGHPTAGMDGDLSAEESGDASLLLAGSGDGSAEHAHHTNNTARSLRRDGTSIGLLLFLYVLQGIPLGLAGSIPMILQNRKVSYKEQAVFSFVNWPFSLKLLWAPIVDAVYSDRFGRRKSWLVPTQYFIGLFMLLLSAIVPIVLGEEDDPTVKPNVYLLTVIFFALNFLAATQDIAVDGWALTMLSRQNVGYASTCNSVGQTAGYFLGNVVFLALESSEFCNRFLRMAPQPQGLVTLSGFLYFWGLVFLVTTTLILFLKKEKRSSPEADIGISASYKMLYRIILLPSVKCFVLFLLTCKMGFAAMDALSGLKLIEAGVPKEHLALLAVPMVPLQILLPLLISRYTAGPHTLRVFLKAFPYRLLMGVVFSGLLWWTYQVRNPVDGSFPMYYYLVVLVLYALHQVTVFSIYVSLMAFHARISDPAIGGTYMTLLNTVTNMGGNWPTTLALWFVDSLTRKSCFGTDLPCSSDAACEASGGRCVTTLDGYHVEALLCVVIGFCWLLWGRKQLNHLQRLPPSAWRC